MAICANVAPNLTLSTPADMRLPLHWIGIHYGKIRAILAATSGIYQATDVIKLVMARADVTMLCSALMRQRDHAYPANRNGYGSVAASRTVLATVTSS